LKNIEKSSCRKIVVKKYKKNIWAENPDFETAQAQNENFKQPYCSLQ